MTTERHAWASARIAQRDLPTLHQVSPTCGGRPVSLTIGRPAASQSSIPPSRFTTSCPD